MLRIARQSVVPAILLMASHASAAEEGGSAFPQLDARSYPNQLFWFAVTFAVLYVIVSKLIVPKMSGVLSAREATIADAIAKAEAYKATADKARDTAAAGHANARTQAAEITAAVQAQAAKAHAEAMAKLNATLDAEAAKADAALKKAVAAATGDMEDASADLARAIAEKLLGKPVDVASVKAARKAA